MGSNDTNRARERVLMALDGRYPTPDAAWQASLYLLEDLERFFLELRPSLPEWLEVRRDGGGRLHVGRATLVIFHRSGRIGIFPMDHMADRLPQPALHFDASSKRWEAARTEDPYGAKTALDVIVEILLPTLVEAADYYRSTRSSGEPPSAPRVPQFTRPKGFSGASREEKLSEGKIKI